MTRILALLSVLLLSLLGAACGGEDALETAVVVSAGEDFDEVPAPTGDVVLTIRGGTAAPNDGDAVSFDLATLERLRQEQWTLFEPFVDRDVAFVGVPMTTLLDVVGVPEGATEVDMVALDDYRVQIPIEALRAGEALLASQDEEPGEMPIERGGPIRIVFATSSPTGDNPDLWIWSVREMEIR